MEIKMYYLLSMIIGCIIGYVYGWRHRGNIEYIGEDF
tara:strand:- start:302 stop:412 length:111 start_codon:yes stop_codon:yes gene_type:complete